MNTFPRSARPHWKPPPDCMSCQEIAFWMRELRRLGWARGPVARSLGGRQNWRKADGKEWIWPTEQIRYSHKLKRILAGEIVLKDYMKDLGHRVNMRKQDAVLCYPPRPMKLPMKIRFDYKTGRTHIGPYRISPNPLPVFSKALENPRKWKV